MLKVLIPRDKRIEFLRAAIKQARWAWIFSWWLKVDYFDDQGRGAVPEQVGKKTFQVCGSDYAMDEEAFKCIRHAVVVLRNSDTLNVMEQGGI